MLIETRRGNAGNPVWLGTLIGLVASYAVAHLWLQPAVWHLALYVVCAIIGALIGDAVASRRRHGDSAPSEST